MCIYNFRTWVHYNLRSQKKQKILKGYYENHLFGIVLYNNGFTWALLMAISSHWNKITFLEDLVNCLTTFN